MNVALLEIDDLSVSRDGGVEVLNGIDLRIAKGERVGLVGQNGAGKSTLLLAMTGVLAANRGTVRMNGGAVRPGGFNPGIGMVFQQAEDQLFSPTVAEDVAFGARNLGLSGEQLTSAVRAAMERVGIVGLEDRPVHHLSGGEKRLVCLAGVLVMAPHILLLDEPSSALDIRNRRRLIELLRGMDQAMVIASHDLEMVLELCDRVVLIDEGRIVADGPARKILGDPALMAAHGQEMPHSLVAHEESGHRHDRSVA